jgi:hypothetical protein
VKIFASYLTNKGLMSTACNKLKKLKGRTNNPIVKWGKWTEQLLEDQVQIVFVLHTWGDVQHL